MLQLDAKGSRVTPFATGGVVEIESNMSSKIESTETYVTPDGKTHEKQTADPRILNCLFHDVDLDRGGTYKNFQNEGRDGQAVCTITLQRKDGSVPPPPPTDIPPQIQH